MTKNFESGRSMVEMLGTLAVMGVLSVGGIAGYSYEMDKYHTNQTVNDVSLRYVVAYSQYQTSKGSINLSEFSSISSVGYPITSGILTEGIKGFFIQVSQVPKTVCEQLKETRYADFISVNDLYLGKMTSCVEDNIVYFVFNMDANWCVGFDKEGNCCDKSGICCPLNRPLVNNTGECISCEGDTNIELGDNIATCSRCSNRSILNGTTQCSKKCSSNEFRQSNGICGTCDNLKTTGSYIENVPENVERVFACGTAMISNYYGGIYAVDCAVNTHSVGLSGYIDTCNRCDNRMIVYNNFCTKFCSEGEFYTYSGDCINCDDIGSWWLDDSPQNRDMVRQKVLACPNMMLFDASGFQATHCDYTTKSVEVTGATHTCAKCPNRRLEDNRCVLIEDETK